MKTLFFFLSLTAALTAGPIYDLIDLGTLGGTSAAGYAISNRGQAVGWATDIWGASRGFRDEVVGTMNQNTAAWDVNNAGTTVGVQYQNGQSYAAVWSQNGSKLLSGAGSAALGINESGQVTGMTGSGHVFVTGAKGEGMIDLGTMQGGNWSVGQSINASGQIAGYGMSGGNFRAFRWTDGTFSTLGTLGGKNGYGMAINDAGWVVGHAQTTFGSLHATLWTSTGIIDLGTLGGNSSYAYGINNRGYSVGYSLTAGGKERAFLYQDGVLYDLNDLLGDANGWELTHAFGINDDGQIVGQGLVNGQVRAFRLDLRRLVFPNARVGSGSSFVTNYSVSGNGGESGEGGNGGSPSGLSPNLAATAVPEPSTWAMVLIGLGLCAAGKIRRNP
jgi:probable HAF family extracellular repeat protein